MKTTSAQRRNIRLTALALSLLALAIVALFVRQFVRPEHLDPQWLQAHGTVLFDTPRSFDAPRLVDQRGAAFDGQAFAGSWSVLFFGFTFCPDVCPTTLGLLAQVEKGLEPVAEGRAPVRFYLVSVDPARDTPAQLERYVSYFSPEFTGLTGEFLDIHRFASQLNIPFRKTLAESGTYSVDHSANLVLINPRGHHAGFIMPPFDEEKVRRVLEVLRRRAP